LFFSPTIVELAFGIGKAADGGIGGLF